MDEMAPPETLIEAVRYFADQDRALAFMVAIRWPDGNVECPTCGSKQVMFLSSRRLWKCNTNHPRRQFSIKIGTVLEDSPIGLDKWMPAIWLIANCKNGISSHELARDLKVTQKTAWFMLHRVRLAMQAGTFKRMSGQVEADESFIGGAARFMHRSKKAKHRGPGPQATGKAAVMGLLERHGPDGHSHVRVKHVDKVSRRMAHAEVRAHVEPGTTLNTDASWVYEGLDPEYVHKVVDHAETYVLGTVHTNGLENFWSLLKRAIKGTYVSVEPFHLFRYLDEQAFRFNLRKHVDGDAGRFVAVLRTLVGRRLTYKNLIGMEPAPCPQ
jgi:transposase-like protein